MDKSKFNSRREWRKFSFGLSVIFFIIASIQLLFERDIYLYLYIASFVFLFVGIIVPVLLKPIYILFSYINFGLGWFMTRLVLLFLYYFVFTPMALIARLVGKNFLDLKFDRKPGSYWISKDPSSSSNYEKMF